MSHEQNQRDYHDGLPDHRLSAAGDRPVHPNQPNQMTPQEREHIREKVLQWIRYTEDSEYLRRRHEELIAKVRGGDTGGDHQGDAPQGMVREQADSDDFEWHPGLDLS